MWQIGVALISGISAKEVVVSSFAVLFGVSNANSAAGMETIVANVQAVNPEFGALNAYCLMLFCLLYVPCVAAIAAIRREVGSGLRAACVALSQCCVAWLAAYCVYCVSLLL